MSLSKYICKLKYFNAELLNGLKISSNKKSPSLLGQFGTTMRENGQKQKKLAYLFLTIGLGTGLIYLSNRIDDSRVVETKQFFLNFNQTGQLANVFRQHIVDFSPFRIQLAKENTQADKSILITPRQRLFFKFASVEYEGIPYMTPQDFLESVTEDHPRPRVRRKLLTKENYDNYLKNTPSRRYGSNRLFRNLEDRGIISYSEYLFLLCVITKPNSNFQIAFNMFDTDGNQRVDKKEFLVLERVINNEFKQLHKKDEMVTKIFQRECEPKVKDVKNPEVKNQNRKMIESLIVVDPIANINTTLLVHFFGSKGINVLKFDDFRKFMEDLQREVLEIEFNEFSKGMNKITPLEFSEILLRYTNFTTEKKIRLLKNLHETMHLQLYSREISFEKFFQFSKFMMNLEDFQLALKFHTHSNRPISTNEFQRAVKIAAGFELDPLIVDVIFKVFDENNDGKLSYKEFIAVLKDRLNRGLKTKCRHIYEFNNYSDEDLFQGANLNSQNDAFILNEEKPTFMKKFKKCIRKKISEKNYD